MKLPKRLCENCFSRIENPRRACPVCGYSRGRAMSKMPAEDYDRRPPLSRGTRLCRRYVIGGSIGNGGFGITYLAFDLLEQRIAAIREYFPSDLSHRDRNLCVVPNSEKCAEQFNIGAEKFFDEAEIVRKFNGNPNIVSIYECFYENNTAYYVMEYLDGVTLEKYVAEHGALEPAQVMYIADKLTMALVVLHSGNVLHRDISPDNIMLCRDGNVKLIDFGAARHYLSDNSANYTVIMKNGFSPAEQFSQGAEIDFRADIYSAGAVLFYALTANVPENPYIRMENDSAFEIVPENIDGKMWAVVRKAAAPRASGRFKSTEDFRNAIIKLAQKTSAIAVPNARSLPAVTAEYRKPKFRVKAVIIAGAIVCAGLGAFFAVNAIKSPKVPQVPESTEIILDSKYAGNFKIAGKIPAEELRKFNSDVEITLHFKRWEDMLENDVCGIIPVNSDDRIIREYIFAADRLSADANGYINIEDGKDDLTFVLSKEGADALADGELCFETLNLIITSADLKTAQTKHDIITEGWYEVNNAPYWINNDGGKIIDADITERQETERSTFTSAIPKQAFYEFDGDVKVTLTIGGELTADYCAVYARNSGYCHTTIEDKVYLIPESENGVPLTKTNQYGGFNVGKNAKKIMFVVPENAKEKLSEGMFFECENVEITHARLEDYIG